MKLKGYRTANGGYITAKELQQQQRKLKKERQEARQEQQQAQERQEYINNLLYIEEKRQQREMQEREQQLIKDKRKFIDSIKDHKLPYNQFLITWDIINNDYYTIEASYNKGKILKTDIMDVLNILPIGLITDYHKELLINL